jgi:hypothetical protein
MHPNQVRGHAFRDFALRRYHAFMQERRELHALAARELRQSVADDQRRALAEFTADISRVASARCLTVAGTFAKNFLVAFGVRKYSNRR